MRGSEAIRASTAPRSGRTASVVQALKAVADPAPLRLLSMVASQPGAEACVCDLMDPLGPSQPTVSHHLKVFVDAGTLHREKRGTRAYFSLNPGALDSLAGLLSSTSSRD
ncbi:DNA-binding transcriptional ArsR family regulator [Frigoribacterium sp. PhB116]|nr:DNA-binding transcriptional ArsR family regulator [Frigoribacterium sp. PhB116]